MDPNQLLNQIEKESSAGRRKRKSGLKRALSSAATIGSTAALLARLAGELGTYSPSSVIPSPFDPFAPTYTRRQFPRRFYPITQEEMDALREVGD